VLIPCALTGWLAVTGLSAKRHLTVTRAEVEQLRTAVLAGDHPAMERLLASIQTDAVAAHRSTDDVLWGAVAHLPVVGPSATSIRGIAAGVNDLARGPLPAVVAAGGTLTPAELHPSGGRIDLAAIHDAQAPLARALAGSQAVARRLDALPHSTQLGSVDAARSALARQLTRLTASLGTADVAARLLPPMLGADGPRRYFLAFQTNAEARGTGGLVGGFGILQADHGSLRVLALGDNSKLGDRTSPAIDLGPEFTDRYAQYGSTTHWNNSNMSPHFPSAAAIWLAMWQERTGQRLDGAIATDPVALSHMLGATGPVRLPDGEGVTAGNVVRLTESTAYARFATDNEARKAYLQVVAKAALDRMLTAPAAASRALVAALGASAGEGRLLISSVHPAEQALLADTPLAGVLPVTSRPYAGVVVNNAGGNKLDYYLGRDVSYAAGSCARSRRTSQVVVKLTNNAPISGLTSYAGGRLDGEPGQAPGSQRLLVSLYGTHGAELSSARVDGRVSGVAVEEERGHPVYTVAVDIPSRSTSTVTYRLDEPSASGTAIVPVQPLVRPMTVHQSVMSCAGGPQ